MVPSCHNIDHDQLISPKGLCGRQDAGSIIDIYQY